MGFLDKLFGTGSKNNPANAGMSYLNQIPGATQPYFQPFIDRGAQSGNALDEQYKQLTSNPGEFFSKLGQGYKQSPGYQFKLNQALNAGQNASAAGGMLGTPADQQQQMGTANDIASQDYNDYMQNVLGLFGMGQQGQQQFQQQGFDASRGYGENLGNVLGSQAQLAYQGKAGQNAARGNNWSNLFKLGGTALSAFGGPSGAAAGSALNLLGPRSYG